MASGVSSLGAIDAAGRVGIVAGGPLSFASLDLRLPSNPNGYFVISREPGAGFLIETNPLFAVGSAYLGSDYLARLYGYDTDTLQKRLGDADYEAYLIRQQLIQQIGSNVIHGYANEAEQMKQMMDQAYAQSGALGLEFGKPLTTEQAASLTQDIVWMEEVQVGGQKVLAPRVYLAANTIASVATGAVIAANDITIGGSGLNNTGGTIAGSNRLTVNTSGDISNTSGTLRGGDVSLASSQGSIRNQTLAEQNGDSHTASTSIGNTASIESTGNLAMNAGKDLTVTGGNVAAPRAMRHSRRRECHLRHHRQPYDHHHWLRRAGAQRRQRLGIADHYRRSTHRLYAEQRRQAGDQQRRGYHHCRLDGRRGR